MKKKILALVMIAAMFTATLYGCAPLQTNHPENAILVGEGTGRVISFLESPVIDYINAMRSVEITCNDYCFNDQAGAGVAVKDYWDGYTYSAHSRPLYLYWTRSSAPYKLYLSTNEDFTDAEVITADKNGYTFYNPFMATTYYWKVENADGEVSQVNSFTTADDVRFIESGRVANIRDLGGRMTSSGKRVKQGLVYRGAELNIQTYTDQNGALHQLNLGSYEIELLRNLKIGTELDFRTDAETNNLTRSNLGESVVYLRPSISSYTGMLCKHSNGTDNPEMRAYYQLILRTIAQAEEDSTVFFHCWGGADRTGTIGFIINGLLGVSYTDLLIDFELTTFANNFRSREDNPDYYNYFNSMVTKLRENYQHSEDETIAVVMERYLKECLYLTDADITALKTKLLEA